MDKEIIKLFKEGNSIARICLQLNITRKYATRIIREANIPIPKHTYLYNDKVFENIDTEEKAYWLGLLYADGCIATSHKWRYLEISLKESDKELLDKFGIFICNTTRIVKLKNVTLKGNTYGSYRVCVNNTKICNDLIKLGLYERKSLTVTFPTYLQSGLLRHFIRGYVDGNGGIYTDKNRLMVTTGSLVFIEELSRVIERELGIPYRNVYKKKTSNSYSISYYGDNCKKLISWLYIDCNIALKRKQESAFAVLGRNT